MSPPLKAIISSTSLDLKEHRREAMNGCLRVGITPIMMELLPFGNDAIGVSLKMAHDADIYVGIFGRRYGHVPMHGNPRQKSITELEFEWAISKKIPRHVFVMDDMHPISLAEIDTENESRMLSLRRRVEAHNSITLFSSAKELGERIIGQLACYEKQPSSRDELMVVASSTTTPHASTLTNSLLRSSVPPNPAIAYSRSSVGGSQSC